jgi:hypothetical protein
MVICQKAMETMTVWVKKFRAQAPYITGFNKKDEKKKMRMSV